MAEPPVDECSLTITDPPGAQETSENSNEPVIAPSTSKPDTPSRWRALVDPRRSGVNRSPGVEDKATEEIANNLEMAVKDAITALEFDYYVLGVALFRLFTTVGFCVIFAILVNSGTPNEQMYTQSNAVSTKLAPVTSSPFHSDTTVQFYDIDSVDDIYDWLTDTFIPTVFVMTDHTGKALPEHQLGHLDLANRVLGGVILDMTPREYESCDKEFVLLELYPMCTYVDYPGTVTGFLDVTWDATKAKAAIATLKQGGTWVNYHSQQLAITVATYSGEVSVFTVSHLKVNFLKTGTIHLEAATHSIPDYRGRTWLTIVPVVATYIIFGWILRYLDNARASGAEVGDAKRNKNTRFSPISSAIQKVRPFLYKFAVSCIRFGALPVFATLWTITISLDFDNKLLRLPETSGKTWLERYKDTVAVIDALDKVAAWTDALSITGAIAVFQLGVFTIHQLSFHPQLNVLARTVVKSLRQFRDFFLVFIIIFITFSFMGNLLFGGQVREFSTAALSRDSCMNMLFGTFNFDTIYNIRGSGWFYWGYMTIVSLILLNMMLAIVMGTYKVMNKDGYQGEINVLLASRISTIHRYLVQYVRKNIGKPFRYLIAKLTRHKPSEKDCHATKKDTSKLNHHHVIAYGKFRPPLLLEVLKTKLEHDRAYTSTTMLTPTLLRGLFPNFPISDKEMIDTFEFLHQGFVLNEAVTKQGQTKKLVSGQTKASRLAELHQILEKTHKEIQILTANETQ
ncbi:hypothetical protein PC121_g2784 [Phytophthora cactorum]|nr:hypothetical protein PC120_g10588 [Phytophthora cactorum]KAG3095472.1 hypothetical protein PC121_g2784 [Phytophthora cactorum]